LLVEVSEAELVDDLAQTLRRCEYVVVRTGSHDLDVRPGPTRNGIAELEASVALELDLHLKDWEGRHPGTRARRLVFAADAMTRGS
jgi:hypothetical protein